MIYFCTFLAWLVLMFFVSLGLGLTIIEFMCEYPVAWVIAFLMFALIMLRNGQEGEMNEEFKEVFFDVYCGKCIHKNLADNEYPCDECLEEAINLYSHKPVNYKENTNERNK